MQKPWFLSIHIKTISRRFKNNPLRGPFSNTCVFGKRKRRLRIDERLKRGKKLRFQKYPHTRGRGLNYNEGNLLFSLTGFSTGEMRRLNWRRTFHEPNLIHWIKYMKSSVSESVRNACFNLERLSRSFRQARPRISPLELLWNSFDSNAELFM